MADHGALRTAGGAGRVADERDVVRRALLDLALEDGRVLRRALAAERLDVGERLEPLVLVREHAARVVVDDPAQRGQLVAKREHLVDLLLVLGDDHRHLGVVPDERQLLGDRVLVHGHRHAAQALRGHLRRVEARAVVADDRELVAALEAERGEPEREVAHVVVIVAPRPRLPDAAILLAHGRAGG